MRFFDVLMRELSRCPIVSNTVSDVDGHCTKLGLIQNDYIHMLINQGVMHWSCSIRKVLFLSRMSIKSIGWDVSMFSLLVIVGTGSNCIYRESLWTLPLLLGGVNIPKYMYSNTHSAGVDITLPQVRGLQIWSSFCHIHMSDMSISRKVDVLNDKQLHLLHLDPCLP